MNRYPLWKYLLLLVVLAVGLLYALPNVFGEQPAVQVSAADNQATSPALVDRVKTILSDNDVSPTSVRLEDDRLLARFSGTEAQLAAAGELKRKLGDDYTVA